ncbi:YqiA/YcfP family alpha/beta fold hydrolase [Burkholderiaceae bacterium UC74_6]
MISHLLYLHGFRSSPQSAKSQRMARWVAEEQPQLHFENPWLPPSPAEAIAHCEQLVAGWPVDRMAIVGSSLGGFFTTVLAEALGCRAAVINPAIDPARDLHKYIGTQTYWHDPSLAFEVKPEFMGQLQAMKPGLLRDPRRYFALIAKGDELLDWREMHARYQGAEILLLEGSDHGVTDFEDHLPALTRFLLKP